MNVSAPSLPPSRVGGPVGVTPAPMSAHVVVSDAATSPKDWKLEARAKAEAPHAVSGTAKRHAPSYAAHHAPFRCWSWNAFRVPFVTPSRDPPMQYGEQPTPLTAPHPL